MDINNRVKELESSIIREVAEKAKGIEGVINLTIGEPDIEVPEIIKERASEYLLNNRLTYAPTGGIKELREEIARYYNKNYGSCYSSNEVIVTVGATEAISTTIRALINEGDEVILTKPAYPLYEAVLKMLGAKIVYIDTTTNGCKLTAKMVEEVINSGTKAIILNYPSNPTGTLLNLNEMDEIRDIIVRNNCYLIADEIYSEIVFDKSNYRSFSYYKDIKERTIIINGFSKSHSMTGWRVGYILVDNKLKDYIKKVGQYTISCGPTLSQIAALTALKEVEDRSEVVNIYNERATFLYEKLKELGLNPIRPQGTFYLFIDYSNISKMSSKEFVMNLLYKSGIVAVPGKAFGADFYIRLSLIQDIKVLQDVVDRLKIYLR